VLGVVSIQGVEGDPLRRVGHASDWKLDRPRRTSILCKTDAPSASSERRVLCWHGQKCLWFFGLPSAAVRRRRGRSVPNAPWCKEMMTAHAKMKSSRNISWDPRSRRSNLRESDPATRTVSCGYVSCGRQKRRPSWAL